MADNLYPKNYTRFTDKRDAKYDGDPTGDFVLAEHINYIQDAVSRIERSIGIKRNQEETIEERLSNTENLNILKVEEIGYFEDVSSRSRNYLLSLFSMYPIILLNNDNLLDSDIANASKIYGVVNTKNKDLSLIQNEISNWKNKGAKGIFIKDINKSLRQDEIDIINSVYQESLKLIVSGDISKLIENTESQYNPEMVRIPFEENTIFAIKDFGYSSKINGEGFISKDIIMNQLVPLVLKIKNIGGDVLGFSEIKNKKQYNFVQTLGLILSVDYLSLGRSGGDLISSPPYNYNWETIIASWKSNNPTIFYENNEIYRIIPKGKLVIKQNNEVEIEGFEVSSDRISWISNTIEGNSIINGSISPNKLSTYDIEKIVDLLNSSSGDISINPDKINIDEDGGNLPTNIPSSNMYKNVIEAVNKKNNINTLESQKIEYSAIKSLKSSQLEGDISKEQLVFNVVQAINASSTNSSVLPENFINIPYADITNIRGTGQVDYTTILGGTASFGEAAVEGTLTSKNITNTDLITSPNATIDSLVSDTIKATSITGVDILNVRELNADNLQSEIIESVKARIEFGDFNQIVTESLKSGAVVSEIISATTNFNDLTVADQGKINDLISNSITAQYGFFEELATGVINTDKLEISSNNSALTIKSDTMKVYSALDSLNQRKLRVILGNLSEMTNTNDEYGFMVLGDDGTSKIFDHTGIYEAGIHDNVISSNKVQDNAITEDKIKHDSIIVDHLRGGIITGNWIHGETITGDKITANAITAEKLHSLSIDTRHLNATIIEGGHIKGSAIEARHIKAGAITTEKLNVGFETNIIKSGVDSFEQIRTGKFETGTDIEANVTTDYPFEGNKSLEAYSYEPNGNLELGSSVSIANYINMDSEKDSFGFSAYIRRGAGEPSVGIRLGFKLSNISDTTEEYVYSDLMSIGNSYKRYSFILNNLKDYSYITPIINFTSTNDTIYIDATQLEAMAPGAEISPWGTTSTTEISGDNITTGRIDSQFIKIGDNTLFGDGDIIELSNAGIYVNSTQGSINIGSGGINVTGGAFTLTGGQGSQNVSIDGNKGITTENSKVKIDVDSNKGFRITNKETQQVIMDVNPTTGKLRFSGSAEFLSKDEKTMSVDFYEQQEEIERQRLEEERQAKELKTQEETIAAQEKIIQEEKQKVAQQQQEIIERKREIAKERMLKKVNASDKNYSLNLEMKVGYNSYSTTSAKSLYFHGYKLNESTSQYELADVDGQLISPYGSEPDYIIPKQSLDLSGVPAGTSGYIIWNNTENKKELDFIYLKSTIDNELNATQKWIKTKSDPNFDFNESVFVIGEVVV